MSSLDKPGNFTKSKRGHGRKPFLRKKKSVGGPRRAPSVSAGIGLPVPALTLGAICAFGFHHTSVGYAIGYQPALVCFVDFDQERLVLHRQSVKAAFAIQALVAAAQKPQRRL